jgi:hypothetical protein
VGPKIGEWFLPRFNFLLGLTVNPASRVILLSLLLRSVGAHGWRGSLGGDYISRKRELSRLPAGLQLKVREGHSDESKALLRRENSPDQFEGKFMQLVPGFDRRFDRSAAGGCLEGRPFDFHRDGPAATIRFLTPGPDIVGHCDHAGFDPSGINEILREGCLRPRGFSLTVGLNRTIVLAAGDLKVPIACFAESLLQKEFDLANPRLSQCQARASWPPSSGLRHGTLRSEAPPRRPQLRPAT